MGYLAFFLFFSILASVPEILNSLMGTEIGNITTIGTLSYLAIIFLYSLCKGFKHKINYVIFSLIYWNSNIGITFYFYICREKTLLDISSILNISPMSGIVVADDIYTSIFLIFFVLFLVISIAFTSGYFLKCLIIYNKKMKKSLQKVNIKTSSSNTINT